MSKIGLLKIKELTFHQNKSSIIIIESETVRSIKMVLEDRMAATVRDIKEYTGLSLATISKYLNGGNVLPENRQLIEKAIEELHYEVNEVARGLAKNKTNTIGVLIHHLDNIFAATVIAIIEDILRQHNYGTIICDCRGDKKLEEQEIKFLLSKRVDGIINIPSSSNSAYLEPAKSRGIPVVLIDRMFEDSAFDSVVVDNHKASYEAVCQLVEHGHGRIGIICGQDNEYTARKRLGGYYAALEDANLDIEMNYVKKGPLTVDHGYQAMKALIEMEERPTAVFMTNYEITLGAVVAMNELGIHFPEDVSVIGFDNIMLAKVVKPKLWMVVQPLEDIAVKAAELILDRLKNQDEKGLLPRHICLDTSIVSGKSIQKISG